MHVISYHEKFLVWNIVLHRKQFVPSCCVHNCTGKNLDMCMYQICQCQCQCLDAVWRTRFGHRRWTKTDYIYKSVFTNRFTVGHAEVVEQVKIVPTMLLCPVRIPSNVPTLFGNRNLRSYDPTHALADLPVEIWRLDSMPISQIPSDVLASVPHNKTGPSAVYIRFLPTWKFRIQIFQLWTIACHSNDQSVCKRGVSKGDLCTWCTGHWRSTPLKRQHGQKFLMHQIFHAMFNLDSCSADYSFRERSGFHTRGPWKQAA